MKRDMDLIRIILITTEKADCSFSISDIDAPEYSFEMVAFHVDLMKAHGLLDANVTYAMGHVPISGTVLALTWDGYDFLDAISNQKVWQKTLDLIKNSVGSTTLSVIKEVATKVALSMITDNL